MSFFCSTKEKEKKFSTNTDQVRGDDVLHKKSQKITYSCGKKFHGKVKLTR